MIYDNHYAVDLAVDNKAKQKVKACIIVHDFDLMTMILNKIPIMMILNKILIMMILNKIPIMKIEKTNQKVWGLHRWTWFWFDDNDFEQDFDYDN